MLRFVLAFMFLFSFAHSASAALELKCEMTNYNRSGYSEKWGKSWIPVETVYKIDGDVIKSIRWDSGKITSNTSDKIVFFWQLDKNRHKQFPKIKGTYFKNTGKVVFKVDFPNHLALRDSEGIWGQCVERAKPTQSIKKAETTSGINTDDEQSFVNVGGNYYYDIFVSKETGLIKIISSAKHFSKTYDEMEFSDVPKATAGVIFFDEKKNEFKKYKIKYKPSSDIRLEKEDGVRVIYLANAASQELLSPPKKYFRFSIQNKGDGYWFASSTLEAACFQKTC